MAQTRTWQTYLPARYSDLRSSRQNLLTLPHTRLMRYEDRALSVYSSAWWDTETVLFVCIAAPTLWKVLSGLRQTSSYITFNIKCYTFVSDICTNTHRRHCNVNPSPLCACYRPAAFVWQQLINYVGCYWWYCTGFEFRITKDGTQQSQLMLLYCWKQDRYTSRRWRTQAKSPEAV